MQVRILARAFWGPRLEEPETGAEKIVCMMEGLRAIDETAYSGWFLLGWSRQEALRHEVSATADSVAAALEVSRTDTDQTIMEDLGFSLSVWNGAPDVLALDMRCHFNVTTPFVKNSVIVALPPDSEGDLASARRVIQLIVRVWEPEITDVWNSDLGAALNL